MSKAIEFFTVPGDLDREKKPRHHYRLETGRFHAKSDGPSIPEVLQGHVDASVIRAYPEEYAAFKASLEPKIEVPEAPKEPVVPPAPPAPEDIDPKVPAEGEDIGPVE